jgi:hypothetical protein
MSEEAVLPAKVPAGQFMQTVFESGGVTCEYVPTAQTAQSTNSSWPESAWVLVAPTKVPAGQLMHESLFATD